MKQHFVTFISPGTFVHETTTLPIESWDAAIAREMAKDITEQHGAKPFAFVFSTLERREYDLDSRETARSCRYYFGVKIETIEEVEARNDPKEKTLLWNMRVNKWDRIVTTTSGWSVSQPLEAGDVVLED